MAVETRPALAPTRRLTPTIIALMLAGTLAIFAIAYAAGALFGRVADDEIASSGVREVSALSPSGTPVQSLAARTVAFDTPVIRVVAGQPSRIRIDNEDAGIFHNIAVYLDRGASDLVARGTLFPGPAIRDYVFKPIPAGAYYFQCDLHPTMNGTFLAE